VSARFSILVAGRLGLEAGEAAALLEAMRAALGRRAFAARAAAFVLALPPGLPRAMRRRALIAFVARLLETPAALNLFGAGRQWTPGDTCAGLRRDG
jgi:hypothetical protein